MPITPANLPGKLWKWKRWKKPDVQIPHDLGASFQGSNPWSWWFLNKTVMCLANLHSRLNITHIPPVPQKSDPSLRYVEDSIPVSEFFIVENEGFNQRPWKPKMNLLKFDGTGLVGGWTNPFEKYARQIGSFPQGSGENSKNIWNQPPRGNSPGTFVEIMDITSLTTQLNFCLEKGDFTSLSWKKPGGRYPQSLSPQKKSP